MEIKRNLTDSEVLIRVFKRAWKVSPSFLVSLILQKALEAFNGFMLLIIPKFLIDLYTAGAPADRYFKTLGIFILITFILRITGNFLEKEVNTGRTLLNIKIEESLSEKLASVKYSYLENTEFLNIKEKGIWGLKSYGAVQMMVIHGGDLLKNIFTVITTGVLIFILNPLLLIFIILLQAVNLITVSRITKVRMKVMNNLAPINRKYGFIIQSVTARESQMDTRMYNMADMQVRKVRKYNTQLMSAFYEMYDSFIGGYSVMEITGILISALTMFYGGTRVTGLLPGSRISIGDLTLYTGTAIKFSSAVQKIIESSAEFSVCLGFIKSFEEIMDFSDDKDSGKLIPGEETESVEFRNVSFKYPGTDNPILQNVSFTIHKNEKISIVGLNGAGKTTIIKLLCRFFTPDEGEILLNGVNIEEYDLKSYLLKIACVFQDYKIFKYSIMDNVLSDDTDTEENRRKATEILKEVGLREKIETLPEREDTLIGKEFYSEGTDLSGGQLQKIAIARALYKNSQLITLDEPTSALDPIAEAEIYENFHSLTENKTAVYISHRMSSSVFCDRIILLDGGKVIACDSHKNLMLNKDSLYYKMFTAQAENYNATEKAV